MSSTPQFDVAQLTAARSEHWHQGSEALLTIEAAREWVSEAGLVLFAPRGNQLPVPAPSLVEATLGKSVSAPTAADSETARGLVARMVAEGSVLPLNLLGGPGDLPDFVVAAQMFGFVFTLRGDKNWKQPPSTSGSVKVSPLALKVYEALAQGTAMTAAELVTELGREVTENAIARALSELWGQMRVIPLLQQDGAGTMWELTSRRFTKQMKAGANAGQPTALSALISSYLAQVFAATEEEIEIFLSPLAARSRVRDVLHGLTAARQLEPVVLEGKTLVYIPGALPEFPQIAVEAVAAEGEAEAAPEPVEEERIRRFDRPRAPREQRGERPVRREGGERGGRPVRREGGPRGDRPVRREGDPRRGPAKPFGERRPARSAEGKSFGERERRPFQRDRAESGGDRAKKSFSRPWDEDRKPRPRRDEGERKEGERPARESGERAGGEFRAKPAFGRKPQFGKGPKRDFGAARPRSAESDRGGSGERPFRPRREAGGEARPFRARSEGSGGERPFRPRREGSGGERPFRPRREGGSEARPFRARSEGSGGERPYRPRPEGGRGERPFRPRSEGAGGARPFRARPEGGGERSSAGPAKPYRRREEGEGGKRPFRSTEGRERSRPAGERRFGGGPGGKPKFGGKPGFGGKPKFGAKSGFAGKPKFGAKRGPAKPGGGQGKFGGESKPSRARDVKAKDMRARGKGEGTRGPRKETEE
ncbi:MAG TPA: hypothetical protein VGU25_13715 [Acidobacteriaceae bacterium]|nr:hypothetical protein [Acidobacteriaceae bacterium]